MLKLSDIISISFKLTHFKISFCIFIPSMNAPFDISADAAVFNKMLEYRFNISKF